MSEQNRRTVGFVGVGAIAADVATAILRGPNAAAVDVVLSPRSAARSAKLAARFPQIRVAADNQAVVDASDVVVIAVLPTQVADVCGELRFRDDQIVAGLAAGWPPPKLAAVVAPATTVCQVIPLPMITLGVGPVVLYPAVSAVEELLAGCGELVVVDSEPELEVLSSVSGAMSSFFAFQNTLIDWAVEQGTARTLAANYASSLLQGLATESVATDPVVLRDAVPAHETPGGLNEYVRRSLEEDGMFTALSRHLGHIHARRRT